MHNSKNKRRKKERQRQRRRRQRRTKQMHNNKNLDAQNVTKKWRKDITASKAAPLPL
jgi:hypothetical protein